MQTIQLAPGDILDEKYRLEKELGRGGFSRVYKAVQLGMDRPVALKLMTVDVPQRQDDDDEHHDVVEQLITRFEQEAKLISRLKSSATINVYDYGQTREGLFFMALEYVQGRTLGQLKPPELPLTPERMIKLLEQILGSLREAHALGIIHRDLKPANIMIYDHLDEVDLIKVLDFGIAKIFDNKDGDVPLVDVTRQGVLVGTPRYMAPELINGKEIGPWSDLYALGLICTELLTGQRAIAGKGELELLAWQLGAEQVQLPAELDVPWGLRQLVNKLCAKERDVRYQNAKQVLDDLAHWRDAAPAPVALVIEAAPAAAAPKRSALIAVVAVVVALLALGGVAFMAGQQGKTDEAVAVKPDTTPAALAKPVEPAAIVEIKPAEVKPAVEVKPVEEPPKVEEKPPEVAQVEPEEPKEKPGKNTKRTPKEKPADKPPKETKKPDDNPYDIKPPKVVIESDGKPKRVVETVEGPLL